MRKRPLPKQDMDAKLKEVMSFMGKRSAEARQKAWGRKEFVKKMREWGRLGGRPRKADKRGKGKS